MTTITDATKATQPVLAVRDLATRFPTRSGAVQAVDGVSFDLQPGERLAVVGESGSGKSVMTTSIMGLIAPPGEVTGSVHLDGVGDLRGLDERALNKVRGRDVAMVFQDPMTALNPVARIGHQLTEPLRRHMGLSRSAAVARALELLGQVGIPDPEGRLRSFPHELSGGMRQRVVIALALSCEPRVILADEPTTALDVTIQAQIIQLLRDLSEQTGTAVLFVTHDLGVVARFAHRVAVMYAGRIVEIGSADQIFYAPEHPYTRRLLASIPTTEASGRDRLATIPGAPPDLRRLPAGCAFRDRCDLAGPECEIVRPSLSPRGPGHDAACLVTAAESAAESAAERKVVVAHVG